MASVLIVDNSPTMRHTFSNWLQQAEVDVSQVYEAGDSTECLQILSQGRIVNLVLVNADPAQIPIADFVASVRSRRRFLPILVASTGVDQENLGEITSAGAIEVMTVPCTIQQLQEKVVRLACEFKCTYCGNCKQ